MPAPSLCIVSGTLYDAGGAVLPNTVVTFLMPQQVIGGATVAQSIISTITDSLGALSPVALPQTAIVFVTIAAGIMVRGIVPAAATGDIAALLSGTVFSGSLSGATVQANSVNLQSQLLINFLSGNGVIVTNPSGGNVSFKAGLLDQDNTVVTVSNTLVHTPLYQNQLNTSPFGTGGRMRFTALGSASIVNGNDVFLNINFAGLGVILQHRLFGGTTTPRGGLPWKWEILLCMNGGTNSWRIFSEIRLQPVELESGLDHPGFGIGNGPTSSLTAEMNGGLDLAVARIFEIAAQWSQLSASNIIQYQHSMMESWLFP